MTKVEKYKLSYRPCVGIVLFNSAGKVFMGERIDTPEAWQMPQGGIDKGEDIKAAALRELKEEIGTDKARIIKIADKKTRYDLPDYLIGKLWEGKFRGQEQNWAALHFTGCDDDIDLGASSHPEFGAWQWVDLPQIVNLIVPFKRDVYKEVVEMFRDIEL